MKKIALVCTSIALAMTMASVVNAEEIEIAEVQDYVPTDYNSPVFAMPIEANQYVEMEVVPSICDSGDTTCASIVTEDAALHYWKGKAVKVMGEKIDDPFMTGIVVSVGYSMSPDYAIYLARLFEMGYNFN